MKQARPKLTTYDFHRAIGQMLLMGWDGTEVTPQIRTLIEEHHLGSILLTAKNLKCLSNTHIYVHSDSPLFGTEISPICMVLYLIRLQTIPNTSIVYH